MREWRKNSLRDFMRRLLLLDESPHRTSIAFGVGVFFGFSPFWGLHTVLGLAVSIVARFNRVAVLIGVWTNTPWTMAPAASVGTALGFLALGMDVEFLELPQGSLVSSQFWQGAWAEFKHLFWPFFVGNMGLALGAGTLGYLVMNRILTRNKAAYESMHDTEALETEPVDLGPRE
jgi:uncharacterized protein (DUF2062 family)